MDSHKIKSVYIHIPFCNNICSYCDFSKMFYKEELVFKYLSSLKQEVLTKYNNDILKTIYLGGGSPSCLTIEQLKILHNIVSIFKLNKDYEFTIELNIEDIEEEKLQLYKQMGINRISIGIQTINKRFLNLLNRNHTKEEVIDKINLVKKYFPNINVDFMYGFNGQTIEDLKKDLDFFKSLNVQHISIYSLILEENTKLYIKNYKPIDEDLESSMYYYIIDYLENIGYTHYEISNFSKKGYESIHNLTYWSNDKYYGFGLGASGYIDNYRYTNTRSINNYSKENFVLEEELQTKQLQMENEMILGLRKIKGINKEKFLTKFNQNIENVFDIDELIKNKLLIDDGTHLYIPKEKLYIENQILIHFIGGCYDRTNQ